MACPRSLSVRRARLRSAKATGRDPQILRSEGDLSGPQGRPGFVSQRTTFQNTWCLVGTIASGVSALCRSVGEVVLYRDVQKGGVWWVIPHVVVSDDGDCVVLYTAPGTPTASMVGLTEETFAEAIGRQGYALGQTCWEDNHVLRILKAGAGHAVELYWSAEEWTFHGWYVHLQTPYRRTPAGFEKRDQALDILVDVEHQWTWKDEHHIALLADSGYLSADEVSQIWREAELATRRIDAWEPPFCDGWETWRPDDAWVDAVRSFRRADLST
jgi:hypothetical protein